MKKKVLIPILIFASLLLILSGGYLFTVLNFKVNGKTLVSVNYNQEYVDEGASFKWFNNILNKNIKTTSNVNTKKLGSYVVTYKVKYLFFDIKKQRIVKVFDMEAPTIILNGIKEANICPTGTYSEEGYTAIDNIDGDVTDKVKITVEPDKIIYYVKDKSGNKAEVERNINRIDTEAPVIKINGQKLMYLKKGVIYEDKGVTATDACDPNVSVKVSSNVDTNKEGKYTVTYTATDKYGNTSSEVRNVVIYDEAGTGIIYLTFDDGPSTSGTTEKILDVLKEEGVPATFFVTGKGSDDLIRREYEEGHKIALHTNTHDYSYLYSSVDNYFKDLYAVQDRVYRLTGKKPTIIRFPGGSNNTVSRRYGGDIMSTLKREVGNRGFIYFDWNVCAEDAGDCTKTKDPSTCVYNTTINGLSKGRENVVLMHDVKQSTANVLQNIIKYAKENGYVFKTLNESTIPPRFR